MPAVNTSTILDAIRGFLSLELFSLSGAPVTPATLLSALGVVAITLWVSRWVRRGVEIWFKRRGVTASGTIDAVSRLIQYLVMFGGFGIALQTVGISFGALFAAGAVFAVGIGFAMQNIAQNFVSGVILLVERAIRRGDIVRVDGEIVRVEQLGIRSTLVQTRDGLELIVPNSSIVQSTVTNYTLSSPLYRIRITVGVTYSSDLDLVRDTLTRIACDKNAIWSRNDRENQVVLADFGSSSIDFQIAVWTDDPWRERTVLSELRFAVWRGFKAHGIVIAFPQVDVHLDEAVESSIVALASVR